MKKEYSAGIIVYRIHNGVIEYLILRYGSGHWDFAKGHLEENETKEQAAHRELKEETNLDAILDEGFEEAIDYYFRDPKTKETINKTVYFYVGRALPGTVVLSAEHSGFLWLPFGKSIEQLTFKNAQNLLMLANEFIERKMGME